MKTIVAGSRLIRSYKDVEAAINESGFHITEIVSGLANGPDTFGIEWAFRNGVKVKKFPAEWHKYGNGAGYRRNKQMAEYADALIAVWDGKSSGTKHMIEDAKKKGLQVFVKTVTHEIS